ncbi:MAG: ATP-dependent transcriptional regulator, partial [Rhodobacteraceae bacterium]|nr:ATP-dependent transcriptional regulator [Paracoccaceae bacterium]
LALGHEPEFARQAFARAAAIFRNHPHLGLYAAHADSHLCAFALADGNAAEVIRISGPAIEAARRGQDAALLANLMMIRAEALDLAGRADEARRVRLDSLGWARYGFGSDAEVRRRLIAVAGLSPQHRTGAK